MDSGKYIHGAEHVFLNAFSLETDTSALPIVFVCPQPLCQVTLWFEGVRIVRVGYATCVRCFKPMVRIDATVH